MSKPDFNALVTQNRRQSDDYVCSTAWSKAFEKEWRVYRQGQQCKKLAIALAKKLNITIHDVIQTKRGKGSETWVHPVIAIDFAEWLSPEFGIFVKEIFLAYLKGDAEIGMDMMLRDHNKNRFERAKKRLQVCETNKEAAALAVKHGVSPAQVHGDRYRGLYRRTASQLRDDAGLVKGESPLDAMSSYDLALNQVANMMALQSDSPNAIFSISSDLRDVHHKRVGKELAPVWEEKALPVRQARQVLESGQLELPV